MASVNSAVNGAPEVHRTRSFAEWSQHFCPLRWWPSQTRLSKVHLFAQHVSATQSVVEMEPNDFGDVAAFFYYWPRNQRQL